MKTKDAETTAGIYAVMMCLILIIVLLSSCSVTGDIAERVSQGRADRVEVRAAVADQALYDAEHSLCGNIGNND
jgi:hypothetical protein